MRTIVRGDVRGHVKMRQGTMAPGEPSWAVTLTAAAVALVVGASCGERPRPSRPPSLVPPTVLRSPEADPGAAAPRDASAPAAASHVSELTVRAARASVVVRGQPLTLAPGATLPGPCVDPGLDGALASAIEPHDDDPLERVDVATLIDFDLDGDGADDTYVTVGGVQDQSSDRIYVLRGACGYPVGTVAERNGIDVLPHVSHGLHDLKAIRFAPNARTSWEVTYRFDGRTYVEVAHRVAAPFRSRALPFVD